MRAALLLVLLAAFGCASLARAAAPGVVINEIFYKAPDDLDEVQWLELHNPTAQPVDLSGWALDGGKLFTLPPNTSLAADGYLVVALNPAAFNQSYKRAALGPLKRPLKRGGEKLELKNRDGAVVDTVRYDDRDPWPKSPDGHSPSLERICPTLPGEGPENWVAAPLPAMPKAGGTPGLRNSGFSPVLPPVIRAVRVSPSEPTPRESSVVEADLQGGEAPQSVMLISTRVTTGGETAEVSIPMNADAAAGTFRATIPAQSAGTLVRCRVRAAGATGKPRFYPDANDLRPSVSVYVHEPWGEGTGQRKLGKIPFGFVLRGGPARASAGGRSVAAGAELPDGPRPNRGRSAFIFVDDKTGATTVLDYVHLQPRAKGTGYGYKLFFQSDRPLREMTAVNLVFEGSERFLLHEALSYAVYRAAGNAAPETEFVRIWLDGRFLGYHLMVERPNRGFLRRNKVNDEGDLFKILWFGGDVVGQHEKKTNVRTGHRELLATLDRLRGTQAAAQWDVIQKSFNVQQVATFFAVNMVLDHWDGYFNNHYVYQDLRGSGKWEMYPWDHDKAWGYHDGTGDGIFFELPLTYGMNGDQPKPGPWWRPAGHFSGPLLANPQFRAVFLKRTREIMDRIYTPEKTTPLIDAAVDRLREDVGLRAALSGRSPGDGVAELLRNAERMKAHVAQRRAFLLPQLPPPT